MGKTLVPRGDPALLNAGDDLDNVAVGSARKVQTLSQTRFFHILKGADFWR